MGSLYNRLSVKKKKDVLVLGQFVEIYCRENHPCEVKSEFQIADEDLKSRMSKIELCSECSRLLEHGIAKLSICMLEPKPSCRKCKKHCYAPGYREKVRKVMRFSGIYLVRHGRLDLLLHYFV